MQFTEKHKKALGIISIVLLVLFTLAIFWFVGKPMIAFVSEPERFRSWVEAYGVWAPLIYIGMVVLQVVVAIIPGEPLEIVGGYAFGTWAGTAYALIGIAIGSAIIFWAVRRFGVKLVEVFFPRKKILSMKFLRDSKRLNIITFIVMFIPGTPKDLLSYFIPLTEMKFLTWMIIVCIARIPSVITSTIGGNALGRQEYIFAAVAFGVTLLISGAGLLIYNKISKTKEK